MIDIHKQEAVRTFVDKEVFVCQTSLVDTALKHGVFSSIDIINYYPDFSRKLEIVEPRACTDCRTEVDTIAWDTGECENCFYANCLEEEIYEWWVVSKWLELHLKLKGEPILSNEYGSWWGKCTTGQALYLDPVIEDIYNEFLE